MGSQQKRAWGVGWHQLIKSQCVPRWPRASWLLLGIVWPAGPGKGLSLCTQHWWGLTSNPCPVQNPQPKEDFEMLQWVQRRTTELVKDLKHRSDEEPGGKEAQGRPYHTLQLPEKRLLKGGWLLIPGNLRQDEKKWPQAAPGRFRLAIRKNFFMGRAVKHLNRLPREVVESPLLEVSQEMTGRDTWHSVLWFSWQGGAWWKVGLNDLWRIFQP